MWPGSAHQHSLSVFNKYLFTNLNCKYLNNQKCPFKASDLYTYILSLHVIKFVGGSACQRAWGLAYLPSFMGQLVSLIRLSKLDVYLFVFTLTSVKY